MLFELVLVLLLFGVPKGQVCGGFVSSLAQNHWVLVDILEAERSQLCPSSLHSGGGGTGLSQPIETMLLGCYSGGGRVCLEIPQ